MSRQAKGIYILDPGEQNRGYSLSDLQLPTITGGTIRFRIEWVLNPNGTFNWKFLNDYIKIHEKAKKPFTLLCMAGNYEDYKNQPWLKANIDRYRSLNYAVGKEFGKHQLLTGWHVVGCSPPGTSEELHWTNPKAKKKYPMTDVVVDANKLLIESSALAFTECDILLAISGMDRSGRIDQIVEYGSKSISGKRFRIKHNALKAIEINAFHNQRIIDFTKKYKIECGWEPAGSYFYESSRMGKGDVNAMLRQASTMARAAGKKPTDCYVAVYWPDIKQIKEGMLA